jgi:hypothetical protein
MSDLYGPEDSKDFHSRFSYHKVTQQNSGYKKIALAVTVIYVLVVTNMALDYVPGWWILGIVGFLLTYCYRISESALNLAYLAVETDTVRRDKAKGELDALQKHCVKLLVASIVVSGIWFYQVQRNQNEEKIAAMNDAIGLVGTEWCANFADIKAYRGPDGSIEMTGYGGWPCLSISSVTNTTFENKKDTLEMCFSYSLNQSNDGPWNRELTSEYDYRELCAIDGDWFESGLDEYSLQGVIRKELESDLETLRSKMCSVYGRGMSYDDFSVYCN